MPHIKKIGVLFPFEFNIEEGGAQQSIIQIIKYLDNKKIDVHILLPQKDRSTNEMSSYCDAIKTIDNVQLTTKFGKNGFWEFKKKKPVITILHGLQFLTFLFSYIKNKHISIIHTNMFGSLFWSCLYKICLNRKIKIIHHDRGFGEAGKNIIYVFRKQIDSLICTSDKQKENWAARKFPKNKLKLIYNTVDICPSPPTFPKEKTIINVGRISRVKNQMLFLKIADKLINREKHPFHFKLIGDLGPFEDDTTYHKQLVAFVEQKGLVDHVEFCGHKSKQELIRIYKKSFALIGCLDGEPFGRVFIESMALGTPVIAVNNGGINSIIEHNQDGFLYPPEDAKVAAAIVTQLESSDIQYEQICKKALKKVSQRFTSVSKKSIYEALYKNIISQPADEDRRHVK